jgi:rRNA maturation protein Nop10
VKRYGKYRRKVSWIVEKDGNNGRKVSSIVKRFGKYRRKLWNDMENMEKKSVE